MYYAQKTTDNLREQALKSTSDQEAAGPIYPHDILRAAYDAVLQDQEVVAGQSSASLQLLRCEHPAYRCVT